MNYRKIKTFLWTCGFLLWLLITSGFYLVDLLETHYDNLKEFQRLQKFRNLLIFGIQEEETQPPSALPRENLLRYLFRDLTQTIKTDPQSLKTLPLPFPSHCRLIYAKKSKILIERGNSLEEYFQKNWEKQTLLAIDSDDRTFLFKQKIYQMPISKTEFMESSGLWKTILFQQKSFYRYFEKIDDHVLLILVNLSALKGQDYLQEAMKLTLGENPWLKPAQSKDLYQYGPFSFPFGKVKNPMIWTPPFPKFSDTIHKNLWIHICFFTVLYLFLQTHLIRMLLFRFEMKILFFYLFFCLFLWFLFEIIVIHIREDLKLMEEKEWSQEISIQSSQIEEKRREILENIYDEAISLYEKNRSDAIEKELHWVEFDSGGRIKITSTPIDPLQAQMTFRVACINLMSHPWVKKNLMPEETQDATYKEKHDTEFYQKIRDFWHLSRFEPQIPTWLNLAIDKIKINDKIAVGKRVVDMKEKWLSYSFFNRELFFISAKFAKDLSKPAMIALSLRMEDSFIILLKRYWERFLAGKNKPWMIHESSRLLFEPFSNSLQILKLFHLHNQQSAIPIPFIMNNQEMTGIFLPVHKLPGAHWFFYDKNIKIYQKSIQLKETRNLIRILYPLFCLLPLFGLYRLLTVPINLLKQAFQDLSRNKIPHMKVPWGKDEISMLILHFNDMVKKIENKKRMMPFVSPQVLKLAHDSHSFLNQEQTATILFSDIRSFTTISETSPPEEIVSMLNDYFTLWQECVEKQGGIVERFIGDAIVVIFMAETSPHHMQNAIETALSVREKLQEFNARRKNENNYRISNGFGIASGKIELLLAGNEQKNELLCIGKIPQFAEKLESASKNFVSTAIFTDESVKQALSHMYDFIPSGEIEGEKIFELKIVESL